MRLNFHGRLEDAPEIRAGFIGCGSHATRNLYPALQLAPVKLVSVCDLELERARAVAAKFGATTAYSDHRQMLEREKLDAVFIVTNYDENGRPRYPALACDCLEAGLNVFLEKPPAATVAEIERMSAAAQKNDRFVMVGFKKMFFPANEKARELMHAPSFGRVSLGSLQYPQRVPDAEQFRTYAAGRNDNQVVSFLDHLCHPMSLLLYLFGMPESLYYDRSDSGAGVACFHMPTGAIVSLAMTHGASHNGGMERTMIVSDGGQHVTVENNLRVTLHRNPPVPAGQGYGSQTSYYQGAPEQTSAVWEPEFSLGQLYNKALFLLGYYGEVNEFARAILERRAPSRGTLEQARQITGVFAAFAEGARREIRLQA
ncbi:MAG TPA: Gfo/Idh/MocA family oxidoreductase [Polyangiaceae bacterium]|nr:Gfo/Idh/MocA family oxidoreductase [Polyangiaceae bacterium]